MINLQNFVFAQKQENGAYKRKLCAKIDNIGIKVLLYNNDIMTKRNKKLENMFLRSFHALDLVYKQIYKFKIYKK